jgi:hypothetical protein
MQNVPVKFGKKMQKQNFVWWNFTCYLRVVFELVFAVL